MQVVRSYLEGRWIAGAGEGQALHNASTGEVIGTTSTAGLDLGAALAFARTCGGPSLRAMSFAERAEVLKGLAAAIHGARDELIELARVNSGNTRGDAKFDIDGGSGTLAWYAALGAKLGDRRFLLDGPLEPVGRSSRFAGQHVFLPRHGVAIHINAFNFPAWGLCEKVAVALLAGMPILTKPATATAVVAARIVELWIEQGLLPQGALSLLAGPAGDLLDHVGPQDVIAFTGSGDTGARIRSHAAVLRWNVPVNVEADSLNASVLGPDVEVGSETFGMFVSDVVRDLTQKAGQKCTAVRRVIVPSAVAELVIEELVDRLSQSVMGDPNEKGTTVGPLATASQQRDVSARIDQLSAVADMVWKAGNLPGEGYFVAPRLFRADGGVDAPVVHDHEVFGPVATVLPWPGDAPGAVAMVARGGGMLVTAVYSDDVGWAREAILGIAPYNGRVVWGSKKIHDQSVGPGTVLPGFVHGGPGRAGGGEELGGERGMRLYWQRTALQGDKALLDRILT